MTERPNFHPLHLPTEFYLAIADVMSKMRIGKSATILWLINEGLRKHGFLKEEVYELYKIRYSRPLLTTVKENRQRKIEDAKPKVRCQWAAGSFEKCRRIGQVMMRKDDSVITSCPEHVPRFRDSGFEVVS